MASSTIRVSRRGHAPFWLIVAAAVATVIAVLPIVGGFISGLRGEPGPRTAFASAPAGDYAVMARQSPEDNADLIQVVPAADPGNPIDIARIGHLPGYASRGVVSNDGRHLALVAVDAGSLARPGASLLLLDLETGSVARLAIAVDHLQAPLWARDGRSVVVTRTAQADGAPTTANLVRVATDLSGEAAMARFEGVLGAYPVGWDAAGRLVTVVLDGRGSTLYFDEAEGATISTNVTRDWRVSPDGTQIAFIEAALEGGLRFVPRAASLGGGVSAQGALVPAGQALGVAWRPDGGGATFGREPGGVTAQSQGAGFDVPLAYSNRGALAVQSWSGDSFASPGSMRFAIESGGARTLLDGYQRFYGWAAR